MKKLSKIIVVIVCIIFCYAVSFAVDKAEKNADVFSIINKSRELSNQGEFAAAIEMLKKNLDIKDMSIEAKREIEWEIERLDRTKKDYSLTEDELYKELDESISNLTKEEFAEWIKKGYFDSWKIDGTLYYVGSSVSNLFFTRLELRERRKDKEFIIKQTEWGKKMLAHLRQAKEFAKQEKSPLVMPAIIKGDMTVTPKKEFLSAGKTVRCWIPYPSIFPQQSEVKFISSSPEISWLSQPQSIIRSAYFEKKIEGNEEIAFNIKYEYKSFAFAQDIDPSIVQPYSSNSEALHYLLEQPPHVVFLPKFKQLSSEILKDETNPYLRAKKIYNWISENIYYSYAREYSTLLNIPELIYDRRAGDCGMEGLLFITLCRMNGIAARWQSGWEFMAGKTGMHDWTEIYIEPYGWLPVDPYMGIFAMTGEHSLTQSEKEELRDLYFGNLDHFRMVANKGHNQKLYPPKNDFRSETVDFQRGEIEVDGKNLYFGQFRYKMTLSKE